MWHKVLSFVEEAPNPSAAKETGQQGSFRKVSVIKKDGPRRPRSRPPQSNEVATAKAVEQQVSLAFDTSRTHEGAIKRHINGLTVLCLVKSATISYSLSLLLCKASSHPEFFFHVVGSCFCHLAAGRAGVGGPVD